MDNEYVGFKDKKDYQNNYHSNSLKFQCVCYNAGKIKRSYSPFHTWNLWICGGIRIDVLETQVILIHGFQKMEYLQEPWGCYSNY